MEHNESRWEWHPSLADPTECRIAKPRRAGLTMVIDKGLGMRAFEDLIAAASPHMDMIKLGFGTSALYPGELLRRKTEAAREAGILIMPGGTFLEVAVAQGLVDTFLKTAAGFGFTAIEVSDGTIEMSRELRSALIGKAVESGFTVVTEYGKKVFGASIDIEELARTAEADLALGAAFVTIEARESGKGVGIFDESGACRTDDLEKVISAVSDASAIMWEAPLKPQQAELLQSLGPNVNIGNVAPEDVIALEALRRGLRSDTFHLHARSGHVAN